MKITLSHPGDKDFRLLFSNINTDNPKEFRLLMVFHKSKQGGFSYPVTEEQCNRALNRKGYSLASL